jgi:hypothetical protein
MCLMLYVGSSDALPLSESADLRIERVEDDRQGVAQWFKSPAVQFVGAHTGCSCGFPSFIAEVPIEYYEGMPLDSDDREADLRSVRALLALLGRSAQGGHLIELYPIADGDELKPPKGLIEWRLESLDPERFFLNEGFMHVVRIRDQPE